MNSIPKNAELATYIYKTVGKRELALTFLPPMKKVYDKAPVFFIIPGGGWAVATKESMIEFDAPAVEALRNKGFATVSIDYRVTKEPNVCMRDIVNDCFDALRFTVHYADPFGIDANRIILSGHSAGSHLALMLAYAPQHAFRDNAEFDDGYTIRGVVPFSAPTVLYHEAGMPATHGLGGLSQAFTGNDTVKERKAMSPYDYVSPACPPTLLLAGTSDHLVYSKSSEILFDKLQKAGVESELILSHFGGHCLEQMHDSLEVSFTYQNAMDKIVEFAVSHV